MSGITVGYAVYRASANIGNVTLDLMKNNSSKPLIHVFLELYQMITYNYKSHFNDSLLRL